MVDGRVQAYTLSTRARRAEAAIGVRFDRALRGVLPSAPDVGPEPVMRKREKFGKFVLLDEVDERRPGRRVPRGQARHHRPREDRERAAPEPRARLRNAEAVKSLMDQVKFAAQLQNPNIVKIHGIGKVDASYYISYEFLEGKSLRAIFARCRQEGFPFSVDHALLIASKVCSALEYAHGRKTEAGAATSTACVTPASVVVSYEGEVRLRGFGYWPSRVREAGALTEDELPCTSRPSRRRGAGDRAPTSSRWARILFETLTGEPLFQGGRAGDLPRRAGPGQAAEPDQRRRRAAQAHRARSCSTSLAQDPAARYGEIQEMRKAVDTLLFSGDFTPTTFNLAFFMHSLFREDIERESKLAEGGEGRQLPRVPDRDATAALAGPPRRTLPGTRRRRTVERRRAPHRGSAGSAATVRRP